MRICSTTLCHDAAAPFVADAIASVAPHVDVIVVIWTSEPGALESQARLACLEAATLAGKTLEWRRWPWQQSFSAARNAALDLATETGCDWHFWVDSDETVMGGENLRLEIGAHPEAPAIDVYAADRSFAITRLVRLPCGTRYRNRTHEEFDVGTIPTIESVRVASKPPTSEENLEKSRRDAELLLLDLQEDPNNARAWLYYGLVTSVLARYEPGYVDLSLQAIERFLTFDGRSSEERGWVCCRAATIEMGRQKHAEALRWACRGIELHSGQAESHLLAAQASVMLGQYDNAIWHAWSAKGLGYYSHCPLHPVLRRRQFRDNSVLIHGADRFLVAAGFGQPVPRIPQPLDGGPRLVVVSTAYRCPEYAEQCARSVAAQEYWRKEHWVVGCDPETAAAVRRGNPQARVVEAFDAPTVSQNLRRLFEDLADDDVVVAVDGDDYLTTPHALTLLAAPYRDGAWVAWSNFLWPDGSLGFCGPVQWPPRKSTWVSSHCKSYLGKLAKAIPLDHWQREDGTDPALDRRMMLAILEMAGPHRCHYVDRALYYYRLDHSHYAEISGAAPSIDEEHTRRAREQNEAELREVYSLTPLETWP